MLYNAWRHIIPALRRRRNFSQKAAAGRAGVALSTWRRWETGRVPPNAACLESIAKAVGCCPRKVAFEYARLLLRYYCKQMGYELPVLRRIAGEGMQAHVIKPPTPEGPVPAPPTPAGSDLPRPEKEIRYV